MRLDDAVETMLAWEPRDDGDRARIWRQLVDLLARPGISPALAAQARARITAWADHVPMAERQAGETVLADPIANMPAAPISIDAAPASTAPSQISDLLARIDAYRADRGSFDFEPEPELAFEPQGFAFRVDENGRLHTPQGAPLLASLAEPPLGVDGLASGAWRAGEGFADARLTLAEGLHAGEWRIAAEPEFDEVGDIIGYSGTARMPRADETARVAEPVPPRPADVDRLDAAIERLREPLETIARAADPQVLPEGDLRAAAADLASRGAALSEAIDAFELAAAAMGDGGRIDAAALLVRLDAALQPLAEARGLKVSFRLARGLPPVDADPQAVERMMARLVGAVVSLGCRGEQVVAKLGRDRADHGMLALSITRPWRMTADDPLTLPAAPEGGADAAELGLGFALRLVHRLAGEAGGRLVVHHDRLILSLPLRADPAAALRHLS